MQSVLGVDVSKAKLDVALSLSTEKFRSKVFTNDARGFNSLVQWLQATAPGSFEALHVCMEATGSFHEALACFLHEQGVAVSVVNPLLVKRFAEANRLRNKTDGADAKCLAMFCRANRPQRWEAPSAGVRALQALVSRLDALQAMRQAECNRLDVAHQSVVDSVRSVIADLDKAIAQVKAQIARTIDDDPDLKSRAGLLQSIPGLGEKTIPQLLAYIGRPERFTSVKAVIAYASLTPMIRQSGTSLDKRRGTHPLGHQEPSGCCTSRRWWRADTTPSWRPSGTSSRLRTNRARSSWWPACTSCWPSPTACSARANPLTPIISSPLRLDRHNGVFTSLRRAPRRPDLAT